jgi:uncharacterized membrane protein YecN with MAPEG domain
MPTIVPGYAGVLALLYVALSFRVIAVRRSARVSLGSGGDPALERRIRAHGNFGEYVPFALILLGFMELQGRPAWLLHALCLVLILARLCHAYAVSREGVNRPFRVSGIVGTVLVLVSSAVSLILRAVVGT